MKSSFSIVRTTYTNDNRSHNYNLNDQTFFNGDNVHGRSLMELYLFTYHTSLYFVLSVVQKTGSEQFVDR